MPGLANYAHAMEGLVDELAYTLEKHETDTLRNQIRELGKGGVIRFLEDNAEDIYAYIQATPGRRQKVKKLKALGDNPLIVYLAWRLLDHTEELLLAAYRLDDLVGTSHRGMAEQGARYSFGLYRVPFFYWPFDDDNPFDS